VLRRFTQSVASGPLVGVYFLTAGLATSALAYFIGYQIAAWRGRAAFPQAWSRTGPASAGFGTASALTQLAREIPPGEMKDHAQETPAAASRMDIAFRFVLAAVVVKHALYWARHLKAGWLTGLVTAFSDFLGPAAALAAVLGAWLRLTLRHAYNPGPHSLQFQRPQGREVTLGVAVLSDQHLCGVPVMPVFA
jgi:hypothetical protein